MADNLVKTSQVKEEKMEEALAGSDFKKAPTTDFHADAGDGGDGGLEEGENDAEGERAKVGKTEAHERTEVWNAVTKQSALEQMGFELLMTLGDSKNEEHKVDSDELEDFSKLRARDSLQINITLYAKNDKQMDDPTVTDTIKQVRDKTLENMSDFDDCKVEHLPEEGPCEKKSASLNVKHSQNLEKVINSKSHSNKDIYTEKLNDKAGKEDNYAIKVAPTDPLTLNNKDKVNKTSTFTVYNSKKSVNNIKPGKEKAGVNLVPKVALPQVTPTRSLPKLLNRQSEEPNIPRWIGHTIVDIPSQVVPSLNVKLPIADLKEYNNGLKKTLEEQKKQEKMNKKEEKQKREDAGEAEREEAKEDFKFYDKESNGVKSKGSKTDSDFSLKPTKQMLTKKKKEDDEEFKISDNSDSDSEINDEDSESSNEEDNINNFDCARKKRNNYFDNPFGMFFIQIGFNLVQEYVQTDMLREEELKKHKDDKKNPPKGDKTMNRLMKTLDCTKENNKSYRLEMKMCRFCDFKTESAMVMAHHLETPHIRNNLYSCNFCKLEVPSSEDILLHVENIHHIPVQLERSLTSHLCPNCPYENAKKGNVTRHLRGCAQKFFPEMNQAPPLDWEPPARVSRHVVYPTEGSSGGSLTATSSQDPRHSYMSTPAGPSSLAHKDGSKSSVKLPNNLSVAAFKGPQSLPSNAQHKPGFAVKNSDVTSRFSGNKQKKITDFFI